MIVDDALLFPADDILNPAIAAERELKPLITPNTFIGSSHNTKNARSFQLLAEMAMQPMSLAEDELRRTEAGGIAEDSVGLLDAHGHRQRAGYLSRSAGSTAYWALNPMPGPPLGMHASSGPTLSPPCRERMLNSLEHDAPEKVLDELRKMASNPNVSGVAAWRMMRDKERSTESGPPRP